MITIFLVCYLFIYFLYMGGNLNYSTPKLAVSVIQGILCNFLTFIHSHPPAPAAHLDSIDHLVGWSPSFYSLFFFLVSTVFGFDLRSCYTVIYTLVR